MPVRPRPPPASMQSRPHVLGTRAKTAAPVPLPNKPHPGSRSTKHPVWARHQAVEGHQPSAPVRLLTAQRHSSTSARSSHTSSGSGPLRFPAAATTGALRSNTHPLAAKRARRTLGHDARALGHLNTVGCTGAGCGKVGISRCLHVTPGVEESRFHPQARASPSNARIVMRSSRTSQRKSDLPGQRGASASTVLPPPPKPRWPLGGKLITHSETMCYDGSSTPPAFLTTISPRRTG